MMITNNNSSFVKKPQKIMPAKIIMVFIDGIGIGENDRLINPCTFDGLEFFQHFSNDLFPKRMKYNGIIMGLDANLDVGGLPQSATGQTALFTGINASKKLGRHLSGFPNQKLRDLIAEFSIFKILKNAGKRCAFLNGFRPPFFDYNPEQIIKHLSATTVMNYFADLPFFGIEDILEEKSVYQDISNAALLNKGFDVPLRSPEKAGEIVAEQAKHYDFLLFEYFQTDKAGHSRNMVRAVKELVVLEKFLDAILKDLAKDTVLIVTSDHGNIEDLTVKSHTRNLAMTMLFGPGSLQLSKKLKSLTDFSPAIQDILGLNSHRSD